jgi:hypothetical protein
MFGNAMYALAAPGHNDRASGLMCHSTSSLWTNAPIKSFSNRYLHKICFLYTSRQFKVT